MPKGEVSRFRTDLVAEARREAAGPRVRPRPYPKFLGYFERAAASDVIVGRSISSVELSMFQVMQGLSYALPSAMTRIERKVPPAAGASRARGRAPWDRVDLASKRRLPFNESGIFRHYPELDR